MNRDRLTESIKAHEGYRVEPYRDHLGKWTGGTGHLLQDIPLQGVQAETVGELLDALSSPDLHATWLENDIDVAIAGARDWLAPSNFDALDDVRQEVCAEMAFQMGAAGVAKFQKTGALIVTGNYVDAGDEMLDSRWAHQTPERAARLAERMRTGQYETEV